MLKSAKVQILNFILGILNNFDYHAKVNKELNNKHERTYGQ